MSLSSPGVGSGLDVQTIVQTLVEAEITPTKNRLDKQETSIKTELSALGMIKSSLTKLQSSLSNLSDINNLYKLQASVGDESVLTASVTGDAYVGNYQLDVQKLATKQSLATAAFADSTSTVGDGSITIDFGTYSGGGTVFTPNPDKSSVTIDISAGTDNLLAIRDAINNSGSGIQASIVQDSLGARLTLTSPETGEDYAMKITVSDNDGDSTDANGLSALAYDPTIAVTSLTETVAAIDSEVLFNGLLLKQSSNELKDVIEGVTVNLKQTKPGTLINVSVTNDKQSVTKSVNDFIKQYNETMTQFNNLTGYSAEEEKGGVLQGDATLRSLKLSLSKLLTSPINNTTNTLRSVADAGIKTNENGMLVLNTEAFDSALSDHYAEIGALFAKTASTTDSSITVDSVGSQVPAGNYDIVLDQFIPGSSLSGTIGGLEATSSDGISLAGSANYSDLNLKVYAGTTGYRGQVQVTDGLAIKLSDLLDSYLGTEGNLTKRTDQLDKRIDNIDVEREKLQIRAESVEARYSKQFNALDLLLSQMQTTSDFLTQQLANLPKLTLKK